MCVYKIVHEIKLIVRKNTYKYIHKDNINKAKNMTFIGDSQQS